MPSFFDKPTISGPDEDSIHMLSSFRNDSETLRSLAYQPSQEDLGGLDSDTLPDYTDKATKRALRKIDFKLVPILAVLYQFSFMDRGNIVNAKTTGMIHTLDLSSTQYRAALAIYFFTYANFAVPSNIMLKRIRPSTWLACITVAWGVIMACQGAVSDFTQLLVVRLLLGACEAGILPAITYLLTTFYCRYELQRRLGIIVGFASIFEPVMGIAALGAHRMNGGGREGWQWSTIGLGVGVVMIGLTLRWTLPDSPATTKSLSCSEKALIERRLMQDSGTSAGHIDLLDRFSWRVLRQTLMDWKLILSVLICQCCAVVIYFFSYAVHPILSELGYGPLQTQLLAIPPYVAGAISTIALSWFSDKKRTRWTVIVFALHMPIISFIALLVLPRTMNHWFTYAVLFNIPVGAFPAFVTIIAWTANNLAPTWRRAIGIAFLVSIGNAGGAFGYSVFRDSESPKYYTGYGVCLGACVVGMAGTVALRFAYRGANRKRDQLSADEVKARYTVTQLRELGDKSPLYRYVL